MPRCKNIRYAHDNYYGDKYHAYCLDCENAGVPELADRIRDLEAEQTRLIEKAAALIGSEYRNTGVIEAALDWAATQEKRISDLEAQRDAGRDFIPRSVVEKAAKALEWYSRMIWPDSFTPETKAMLHDRAAEAHRELMAALEA